jgi:hypothetical protein
MVGMIGLSPAVGTMRILMPLARWKRNEGVSALAVFAEGGDYILIGLGI